jgi:hypothetical protein
MTQSITDSSLRDQWILEQLENGSLELDFSIDEEGNLSSTGRLVKPAMV